MRLFIILTIVTELSKVTVSAVQFRRFAKTDIEVSKIKSKTLQTETITVVSDVIKRDQYAAYFCNSLDWCSVFCRMTEESYLLANATVSPFRTVSDNSDSVPCFTSRPHGELIGELGASVSVASATHRSDPRRPTENLLDSFYDGDRMNCYLTETTTNPTPYIVFDLGERKTVTGISMTAQNNDKAPLLFQKIDMRLGDALQEGDFDTFTRFEYFDGAATEPGFRYHTSTDVAVEGRFVSFQTYSNQLQICHIEIFGY